MSSSTLRSCILLPLELRNYICSENKDTVMAGFLMTWLIFNRLKIAFKWLVRAFSGYLSSDQVLLLWDRVLAYGTLDLLPGITIGFLIFQTN